MLDKLNINKEVQSILEKRRIDEYINSYFYEKPYYKDTKEYKQLEKKYIDIFNKISAKTDIQNLEDLIAIIYDMTNFDIRFAYKVGLVDGIITKNECEKNKKKLK